MSTFFFAAKGWEAITQILAEVKAKKIEPEIFFDFLLQYFENKTKLEFHILFIAF